MLRCPELSRLPKTPRFSSILWRHQSPGSIAALLAPNSGSDFLDSSHPAARRNARGFPQYKTKEIQIRIFPVSLLQNPPSVIYPFRRPFLTWNDRVKKAQEAGTTAIEVDGEPKLFWKGSGSPVVGPEQVYHEDEQEMVRRVRLPECRATPKRPFIKGAVEKARRRVPMSFFTMTSKARMGAKRCTRRSITLRVKAALNLIVTRGAYYGEEAEKNTGYVEEARPESVEDEGKALSLPTMRFDKEEAESMGRKWILQGWSYVFAPTVEVYRMPYSKLIPILRDALTKLNTQAIEMENKWLAKSLVHEQRMALKGRRSTSREVVTKEVPQNPVSKPSTSTPRRSQTKTATGTQLRSSFDDASWKNEFVEEMRLLAQVSKVKA